MAARSLITSATRISMLARSSKGVDALLGTENLLLQNNRDALRDSYEKLFSAVSSSSTSSPNLIATSLNTSVSFLDSNNFYADTSRANDITYYVVGRAKKGVSEDTGEEYAYDKQGNGSVYCIPRQLVSLGEKRRFADELLRLAVGICGSARDRINTTAKSSSSAALMGASIFMEDDAKNVRHQILAAASGCAGVAGADNLSAAAPDAFVISGCDTPERVDLLKEILSENEKKMVRLGTRSTTGRYIENDEDSELGFDIPALIIRDDQIVDIL